MGTVSGTLGAKTGKNDPNGYVFEYIGISHIGMKDSKTIILSIESSCDDTSAAVLGDGWLLSNVMASQEVHRQYGGVIPELASRAHQQNILPVVSEALRTSGVKMDEVDAIAFTRGPGLLGSLIVGTSFAKGLSLASGKPLVEVNHLQGHILSHFIKVPGREVSQPEFPFLALLVSGGHTQIVRVDDYLDFTVLGQTIDDAVGEAFDKCAKMLGLGYPGGPVIDRLAKEGDPGRFRFAKPSIPGLDFSFSGIKTSLLYFLLCASFQKDLIDILMKKIIRAAQVTGIRHIVAGGGVAANSGLRDALTAEGERRGWKVFLPELRFTTDNAAMIGIVGYYKYQKGLFCSLEAAPISRAADYQL